MARLQGQVAIVTGGSRGIGREMCLALAAEGARVAVVSRIRRRSSRPRGISRRQTVSRRDTRRRDRSRRRRVDGRPSHLGAGPCRPPREQRRQQQHAGPTVDADPVAWWRDVTINLLGPFHTCRAVLPGMLRRGRGRIVNVMGAGTAEPYAYLSGYGSSKAALMRFTETVNLEVETSGVRVVRARSRARADGDERGTPQERDYQRLFPEAVAMFEQGLDSPPTMAAALAVEIASGGSTTSTVGGSAPRRISRSSSPTRTGYSPTNLRTLRLRTGNSR